MTDDEAALQISLAIGLLDIVMYHEQKTKPKGARASAVRNLIDNSLRVIDLYRINALPPVKLKLACEILDAVENTVNQRCLAYFEWRSWEDYA